MRFANGPAATRASERSLTSVGARYNRYALVIACVLPLCLSACGAKESALHLANSASRGIDADSMGAKPENAHNFEMREPSDLVESSAAVISPAQPDLVFTINDSGNDPVLFAMDTLGNLRGRWNVEGASNRDWEAASRGPCISQSTASNTSAYCLYIGDVGDNGAARKAVTLYQVAEPLLPAAMTAGSVAATRLTFRYPDRPHDVEAMYVGPDRTIFLITKRPLKNAFGALRQSLVFTIPPSAWAEPDTVVATLSDSLPIVPGTSEWRNITDASLSTDSRLLAVRTYGQIYVFATDTATGRVQRAVAPAVCNINGVESKRGEGVTWTGNNTQLLLTNEGRNAPMHRITCPLPKR